MFKVSFYAVDINTRIFLNLFYLHAQIIHLAMECITNIYCLMCVRCMCFLGEVNTEKCLLLSLLQERFQVKNPPHTYIQKLKGYLDPAVTRKVRSILVPPACPSFLSQDGPGLQVPSCLCANALETFREKQREIGNLLQLSSLGRRAELGSQGPSAMEQSLF